MRSGEGLRSKALAATASSLVSAGVLGVAAVVMARTLGPTGRGEFASSYSLVFVLVVLVLVVVGHMGVGQAVGRHLSAI